MPGYLLHTAAVMACPHAAPVSIPGSPQRVLVSGQYVTTASATLTVTACPFQIPGPLAPIPQPCVPVMWANYSSRIKVNGQPVLLQASEGSGNGNCFSATLLPAGPPNVAAIQQRVLGS